MLSDRSHANQAAPAQWLKTSPAAADSPQPKAHAAPVCRCSLENLLHLKVFSPLESPLLKVIEQQEQPGKQQDSIGNKAECTLVNPLE